MTALDLAEVIALLPHSEGCDSSDVERERGECDCLRHGVTPALRRLLEERDKAIDRMQVEQRLRGEFQNACLEADAKVREFEQSFDLYYAAIMRGQKLWRDEAPAERELLAPDTGKLVAWLLRLVERAESVLAPLPFEQRVMIDGFPRRNRMDQWLTAEHAIYDAVQKVELVGAHVWLTDAVILLGKARDRVSDYIDDMMNKETARSGRASPNEDQR